MIAVGLGNKTFKVNKIVVTFGFIISCYCLLKLLKDNTKDISPKLHTIKKKTTGNITLDDIFISVKTSKCFEATRLPIILKTWFQLAKRQTWFFTDSTSHELQNQTNGHMINTKCSPHHDRKGLNCKMGVEYNYYMSSGKKWFCHFDDDNYVNVFRLISLLREYDYNDYWYLGKRSKKPIKVALRMRYLLANDTEKKRTHFTILFATGGAGFCISKSLAIKMFPVAGYRGFYRLCRSVAFADDVCVGFIVEYVTMPNPVRLTEIPEFHSHIELMKKISVRDIPKQISFSYKRRNILNIPELKTINDPSRLLSLHCFLYPYFEYCWNEGNKTRQQLTSEANNFK